MRIAFIIVNYRTNNEEILRLKKEIRILRFSDFRIYNIDNTKHNKGYAFGVNQGISKAIKDNCKSFIILNPDISFSDIKHDDLLTAGNYFDIWGLAMKQDNKIYYGGEIDKWRMSGGLMRKRPNTRFSKADFVTGSLMFIKKEVIDKIGFFDEKYFMYYEDVEYCWRAKQAGFNIGIDSQLIYNHLETSKSNKKKNYWLAKSRAKFFWKYSNWQQKIRELIRLPKTILELLQLFK